MKDIKRIFIFLYLVFPLFMNGQESDTTRVKIICEDYFVEIKNFKLGDTVNLSTIFKTTIKVIPYDTLGSMSIYEFNDGQCIVYKEYIGTGQVVSSIETFWDSENNIKTENKNQYYEQLKNGVWKYWNSKSEIIRYEIYCNGNLMRTITR